MQVIGVVIGRVQKNANETNDTVKFQGKIRLKIRDSSFSFEDFLLRMKGKRFMR